MSLPLGPRRNVEEVARFPGLPPRRQLTYQAKQMIAREIEMERMRRAEAVLQARNPRRVRLRGRGGGAHCRGA